MTNSDSAKPATDRQHESYADDAKAQRVLGVLSDSTVIDETNRLPVDIEGDTATISKFIDFMGLSNATISGQGGNATSTWVAVNVQFNEEVVLKAEDEDKMTLTINDDLSGLLYLRVGAGAKVEDRE